MLPLLLEPLALITLPAVPTACAVRFMMVPVHVASIDEARFRPARQKSRPRLAPPLAIVLMAKAPRSALIENERGDSIAAFSGGAGRPVAAKAGESVLRQIYKACSGTGNGVDERGIGTVAAMLPLPPLPP